MLEKVSISGFSFIFLSGLITDSFASSFTVENDWFLPFSLVAELELMTSFSSSLSIYEPFLLLATVSLVY